MPTENIDNSLALKPSAEHFFAYSVADMSIIQLKHFDATKWDAKSKTRKKVGKTPSQDGWRTASPMTQENAEYWASTGGNLGVRLPEGFLIVDFDPRNAGANPQNVWDAFKLRFGLKVERYAVVKTGGGGHHLYMRCAPGTRITKGLDEFPGVDLLTPRSDPGGDQPQSPTKLPCREGIATRGKDCGPRTSLCSRTTAV